jgi:penicillin amidase
MDSRHREELAVGCTRNWAAALLVVAATAGRAADRQRLEVWRDPWGVPHVFAAAAADGFFGWGYACAEDRRLQMELVRRKGAGRLAEVFGPEWVRSDREARLAGFAEYAPAAFARLPTDMQDWLRAYAAGVNAWTAAHPEAVARRFQPVGTAPEPWTPADCLLAARAALALGSPFSDQPAAAYHRFRDLAAQVGEAEAGQRSYMAVEDGAAIVSEAEMARDTAAYERLKSRPRMPGFRLLGAPAEEPKMSHAWAVSGARSKTGRPLLESDPQLPLGSPPFFHEVHLVAAGIDARGLAIPGCPGLFIGFNRRVAWGMSALGAGSQAVFLETLTADGAGYRFAGQSVAFARRLERIVVKGGADVVQEVLTTRHGVVFDSLTPTARAGEAQVLHDAQTLGHGATARALLAWLTAGNWAEFRAAMEHYYDPGVHLVYADADGNLGYQTLVYRPLTSTSPRLAQEGWTGEQEVSGRIPLDELPHMLNPASGVISHANNMPVGTWYPYDLGIGTGGNGHTGRSWRLQRLLSGTRTFAVEDFEAEIHRDAVNQVVAALLPVARRVAEEDGTADPAVTRLLAAVAGWDLRADRVDRCPAAAALQNAMTPYRGSGLNDAYGAGMGGVTNLARRLAADFERDGATPRGERERAYLHRWLQAAAQGGGGDRRTAAGDDWTARLAAGTAPPAGRTITIPYQRMAPLNLPAVDAALDITSPPLACLDTGTIWSQPGNFYTQIVDLADIDNSRAMIAPGNSEDATDPQRTAGIELWVEGRTRPAPLSRARVERLGGTRTEVAVLAYSGPDASPLSTVEKPEAGWLFVAAIPPPAAATPPQPRPRPADAQRPDDPRIEAHFRVILRQDTPAAEVDAQLAACREYVGTDAGLVQQLRGAAVLGVYLIEESTAGRLKVQYGSPHALDRLRGLLTEIDAVPKTPPAPPADPGRAAAAAPAALSAATGLIGHWPLRGDCADVSGNGLHGTNHGVSLQDAVFDGRSAYIEVPPAPKLQLGTGDFALAAWVWTAPDVDDVIGDVVSLYDPVRRCGFSLTLKASAGGYSSQGDDRHAGFGIDNAQEPAWEDCGRPSPTSNYVSNSLTVFDGHLYAAITDAERTEDWCHVFRYAGGQAWEDCGRVGDRRTHGVGPMVVHRGSLYAATWTYDWTRVGIQEPLDDYGCVYRYAGGTTWEDCGQPGQCRRLFGLASFRGALYVTAEDGRCYVHAGGREWRECGRFPNYAHPLGVHDGKLYAGVLNPAGVWAFDGERWEALGNPQGSEDRCNQIHALQVFRGRLHATTWPEGHVVRLEPDGRWLDCGRLGDALEINALNVHNGQLYAGTIPRAEVFRYAAGAPDTGSPAWSSVGRFLDPAGYEFKTPNEWARVTSLTTFQGRQYASLGSCTSSRLDAPCDFRGRVFAMQAGPCVSVDRDLGPGWKHLTAVRRGNRLDLHVDGRLAATSPAFRPAAFDLSSDSPLRIGFGEVDYFSGRIRDVRLYGRALGSDEIAALAAVPADPPPRAGAEAAPGPAADPAGKAPATAPRRDPPTPRATRRPEVWLCTGSVGELLRPDADWSFVKQNLDGIKFYVGLLHQPPPGQLAELVAMVRELGLQVAVELGCCLDFGPMDETNGEWSARSEIAALDRWYAVGGTVDYLDLDGPVRRLLFPENRDDGKRFDSLEAAVAQVVKAVDTFRAAHPGMQYWHLTNFPNWGYKGGVSYHARGPNRQDYGEYDDAHRLVLDKLRTAALPLEGVTIDNPYDYLVGEHLSVNLKPATTVDWIRRVRDYEDRSRSEGLTVNLIVNSERGGQQSDALFAAETLKMVDAYREAGGRPDRWIVQSWYPYPKAVVPETDPTTMTGLVKAVIERVRPR